MLVHQKEEREIRRRARFFLSLFFKFSVRFRTTYGNHANHFFTGAVSQESPCVYVLRVLPLLYLYHDATRKYIESTPGWLVAGELEYVSKKKRREKEKKNGSRRAREREEKEKKVHTFTLSFARVLMNPSVGMLRSRPLLVRASPMDCQAPRQKLRRNTPTHLPPCNPRA